MDLSGIPLHTWATLLAALLNGGVFLGWVASMNWKRALKIPAKYRSISYVYGTTVILLSFAEGQVFGGDSAAVTDLVIVVVLCGLWTFLTHLTHANDDATETAAVVTALPIETGEGDDT